MIVSVYLVMKNEKDEVLLLKRQNTGFCDGQYGLPAGHVDGGETVQQAMVREAQEEAGIAVKEEDLKLCHVTHRNCGDHERIDFFFMITHWEGEPQNVEPEKCSELAWYPLDAIPENTIDYYRQMFECVGRGEMMSVFGF